MGKIGNHSNLIGRFTKDPEIKKAGENSVVNFTLARNRDFSKNDDVDFIDCVAWGKLAETIVKYFKKGNRIGVSGSLQTRTYENSNNVKIKVTEIRVEDIEFIDLKSSDANTSSEKSKESKKVAEEPQEESFEEMDTSDEDMPF